MKIINTLILVLLINATNFAGEASSPAKSCVRKLKAEIKNNWIYNKDSSYYTTNFKFLGQLDSVYQKCLNGASPQKIINLFNKSKTKTQNKSLIGYSVRCNKNTIGTLYFRFDKNNKLKNIYSVWIARPDFPNDY